MGEKYVQEEFLGEDSVGEKYMGEKSVGEKSFGENRGRWGAGFRSPMLRLHSPLKFQKELTMYCHIMPHPKLPEVRHANSFFSLKERANKCAISFFFWFNCPLV